MTNATDHDDAVVEAEIVDEDATPQTSMDVVRVAESALMQPVGDAAAILAANRSYQHLCESLLVDDDYQQIQDKKFRKKSAWRKLAAAFGVSDEIVDRQYDRDDQGRIIRAEVVVRAIAPNGRTSEALGACDLWEKCCHSASCRKKSQYHKHCDQEDGHDPASHFSHAQHDIPSTAQTRAKNRALSDLFGMGEVSAEEVGEPERWELLGYPSAASFQNVMEPLVEACKADAGLAAKWKEWRAEHKVEWPPEYRDVRDVRVWMAENIGGQEDEYAIPEPVATDGAPRSGSVEVEQEVAATAPAAPPAPSAKPAKPAAPKPKLAPTPGQLQKLAIACGEIAKHAGFTAATQKDEVRHAFVAYVTDGRVDSGTKMTRDEASRALDLLDRDAVELVATGEADRPVYFQPREAT